MNYIGIDIGGTNLKAGLVNDEGSILAMEKRKIAEVSDQKALVEALVALTQSLTERGGLTPEQIRSVGVGVPGAVEIHSGAVLSTCNLPLRNVPLRKLFHRYLPYPLYVENDANCAALAEYYAGAGKGSKRFVTITLGTGVGAGILHNGQIYHGANGMAGEVGPMSIVYHGEPCPCGRTTARMENLSGRTDDMLKIRGVNVFPSQIEEVLINTEGIGPNYEIVVDRKNHSDILIIKVEVEAESMMDSYAALERLEDTLKDKMRLMLGLDAKIQLVSPNTLQRFEVKGKRVTDLRKEV